MLSFIGVNFPTSASGSQPPGNTKNDRIQQTQSRAKKNKLEAYPRNVRTSLHKKKSVVNTKAIASVPNSKLNVNSDLKCTTCNGCLFFDNHDSCVLEFINFVNARVKSKSAKKPVVQIILWYLDSECSMHMTGDRSQLTNFIHKFMGTVKFGNDHVAKIMDYGDYKIGNVTILRVYFVEGLGHNLFSDHLCSACAMGKSKKKSHKPKFEDTNQEKLYHLHMDLCGPMRVKSVNEKKYILIIVDDYSRFTWVKCLRSKDEAPDFIIKFLKMIQVRLKVPFCRIRTNNGTEFVTQTLREYYEQVGISHETSVTQNGVVKRRNRTLIEAASTIENLGKLQPKTDIGIFIGYTPTKKAFRIYNRRIVPKPTSSTTYVPPSRNHWDLLFQPLFDELLTPSPSVDPSAPEVIAPIADQQKKPPTPYRDWNKTLPATYGSIQPWGLVELKFFLEEVYKATIDQLDWNNPKGQQYPRNLLKPLPLIPNSRGHRVILFDHFINNDLEYLRGGNLTNLTVEERIAFNVSLRVFTRRIVIQRRVEDLQLGVESYKKKLNLTKTDTYHSDLKRKEAYTAYSNPRGFIYQNKDKQNRLMQINELHKFTDEMLNDVCTALDDHLKGIRIKYLPQTIWRKSDKERVAAMI
nr:integrase, catalytic region, zinc finger, CCHC-type, peptidase aspartic, catalytic [Tanacetum cinerariifolium]